MDLDQPPSLATQLVVPSWWVKAYEAACRAESSGAGAMRLAADAGLAPALTTLELNALAMVLASVQAQIFAGRPKLVIGAEEHLKHASTNAKTRRFAFEKLIQILVGLRLLRAEGEGFLSYPVFGRDAWRARAGGELEIELVPEGLGHEILLGQSDAHWDLVRRAQGRPVAADVLGGNAPLTLRRSVWLDLQAQEQWLFLRLERSIQWEFRWLQLDGVFGLGLRDLFRDVPLPAAGGTTLSHRLKLLAKLGKKLGSHGFLAKDVHEQYLALGADAAEGLTAVWQVSRDRLAEDAAETYRAASARALAGRRHGDLLAGLVSLVLPDADARRREEATRAYLELLEANLALPVSPGPAAAPNQLHSPLTLFWELSQRGARGARYQVPAGLLEGRAASFFDARVPATQRLAEFATFLAEDPDFARTVQETPFASLASAATLADPAFARELSGAPLARAGALADQPRPRLVAPDEAEAPAAKKKAALNGALAARMLKVASEELQKLKASHPERYKALKKAYLESLDELGRKLMLDVQRRMQPTMFDEHLRQRLVRYMVDHPGAWRSPSAQLAEI